MLGTERWWGWGVGIRRPEYLIPVGEKKGAEHLLCTKSLGLEKY